MAILANHVFENGTVRINDACYLGKHEEELQKLRENAEAVGKDILAQAAAQENR